MFKWLTRSKEQNNDDTDTSKLRRVRADVDDIKQKPSYDNIEIKYEIIRNPFIIIIGIADYDDKLKMI